MLQLQGVLKLFILIILIFKLTIEVFCPLVTCLSCASSGYAPSLYWGPVSIFCGCWSTAANGSHCCDLSRSPRAVHDSNCCPSLPRGDRPASQHHCSRSALKTHVFLLCNFTDPFQIFCPCWPLLVRALLYTSVFLTLCFLSFRCSDMLQYHCFCSSNFRKQSLHK